MPLPIWIADALQSSKFAITKEYWRCVEAQHKISTMALVDTQKEQEILEDILEESKPAAPPECRGLHYLYMTPFRYGSYPNGSRFRKPGFSDGVFYASERPKTAIIETGFNLLLFYLHSPKTPFAQNASEQTVFNVPVKTDAAIDLTKQPFDQLFAYWHDLNDYSKSRQLEAMARKQRIELILYQSVRDPEIAKNIALLNPKAFARKQPGKYQSWKILFNKAGIHFFCERPKTRFSINPEIWKKDKRIAARLEQRNLV